MRKMFYISEINSIGLRDKGYEEGKIALKKGAYEIVNYLKEKYALL